ncbi:pyrrolo-quinoline quinone [Acidocella aquatica]|uniref:Pyrrolo-quinoline quinone n=2 Tax=Acidocella aquatica TaxID=1922313 RepID=A0ABQ6AD24_9PROT|nr:pyrrolo-quinoline quinone [Acidocella aquatica]
MTQNMMRRRTALTLSLGLLAASCAKPKVTIIGTQIPVLPDTGALDVSASAPPVSLPPAVALADWPQVLGNAAHAPGNAAGPLGLTRHWVASAGQGGGFRQPLLASPILANGQVFTMDATAEVAAFSATDGARAWRTSTRPKHSTEPNIGGGIGYDQGRIYASTGYGELLALDAGTGKILWRQALDFPTRTAPMIAGGLVALITQNDLLLTFDAATGAPGWRFTGQVLQNTGATVAIAGAPAFADGIVVAGFASGMLAALDANSGAPLWEQSLAAASGQASSLDFSDIVAAPVIAGGVVYALGLGNTAMAVDLHSGAKVWTHSASGAQPFCLAGGFAFLLDSTQTLSAIHADDGLVSWSLPMPAFGNMKKKKEPLLWAGPVLVNGMLVLTNSRGEIALVDAVAGVIKSTAKLAGPADMAPIAAGGLLLQLTRDAKLTAYA